jgi:hypothetical protein
VSSVVRLLVASGSPVLELTKNDRGVSAAVKVGPIKRAKGLELKHVLVPLTPARLVGLTAFTVTVGMRGIGLRWSGHELYVAIARARDGWRVGVVAT